MCWNVECGMFMNVYVFMCLCVFAVSAARVEKNSDTLKKSTTQSIHSSKKKIIY